MKYDPIKSVNYVATIVQVNVLEDLEGLDNLRALRAFGTQALVSKDTPIGSIGILFSTEVQLSEEYARVNNLHRKTNLNADPTVTNGYLDDNRRVKAIKLRGHRSDSLFMPLESLGYLKGFIAHPFEVGDVFDSIDGHEICKKYLIREPRENKGPVARIRRVDAKVFPCHVDTENYWRNADKIPGDREIVVTQKLHGTSLRVGNVPVARDLKWYERLASKVGIKVQTHENKFVVGSRMVVKSIDGDAESSGNQHYYATDEWTLAAEKKNLAQIPEGYLVYGELVGYTSENAAIQKSYTYDASIPAGEKNELFVYRVAQITPQGNMVDLSWEQVKRFCKDLGLKWVPELWVGRHAEFTADDWTDLRYYDDWSRDNSIGGGEFNEVPVPLSDPKTVDEGVCVRWDGPNGIYLLKAKSPIFLGFESAQLDAGEEDTESAESVDDAA